MEVATHAPLSRTHTAPPASVHARVRNNTSSPSTSHPPPLMQAQSHQSHASSTYSSFSHPSSRASDSTQATSMTMSSTASLFPPPRPPVPTATPPNGAPLEAANNVLNRRAEKETSLFQICLNLRQRLRALPEIEQSLLEEEEDADEDTDPVTLLWRTFRRGYPLMTVFNALNLANRLQIDESKVSEKKRAQDASFKFIRACISELKFPADECFILQDLYGDDTTGFVKVTRVVNRVLDILVVRGVLQDTLATPVGEPGDFSNAKKTQRQHIIEELVKTERTYVQHLELLQAFKQHVEEKGVITGDAVHDIFLNLNALLDFQRRFLIRVEQTNTQPETEQNWGKLFILYKDAFKVYEPYIANQKRCEECAMQEFEKLRETGGPPEIRQMVETPTHLSAFLLKPFQRLAKYPLLLKELRDKGDLSDERKEDINEAIVAASAVLERTNAAIAQEERLAAVEDLKSRVEDWKGHRLDGFGQLLLFGTYTVQKGDSSKSKNPEPEVRHRVSSGDLRRLRSGPSSSDYMIVQYHIYLFEMILLCCKEIDVTKQKNKRRDLPLVDKRGKPRLQLKGRIFMQNVTEIVSLSKPGSYTCQIFWKGDPGIENFIIKFSSEEMMKQWANKVDNQRRAWKDNSRISTGTKVSNTSQTEFTYLSTQQLENPYRQQDEDEDDDDQTIGPQMQSEFSVSRTGSSTSLRSRSATGDSGPPMSQIGGTSVPPPRFPTLPYSQTPPLTLRTQQLQGSVSPGPNNMDSYFSPSVDSPMSSRTSSSSGMFPFPRQHTPQNAWNEDHRFTAPARSVSREGPSPANGYGPNGRSAQRPSLPPNAGSQYQQMSQARLRSASSPDIQNPAAPNRRMQNGQPPVPDVPVPPFPTHFAYTPGINRSNTNSPGNPPVPNRGASPSVGRDRMAQQMPPMPRSEPSQQFDYPPVPRSEGSRAPPLSRVTTENRIPERRHMEHRSVEQRAISPSIPSIAPRNDNGMTMPFQLKVKVHCPSAGSTMTLVVPINISYQSLKDRIDVKLQRSANLSLSAGQVKLKYLDEDDFVSIQSDEDVQTAFESWKEQQRDNMLGHTGEIELYCQR
ncbi:hypothetical protein BDY21DRAFT_164177 [Lineolata rhizophorae]|uniref:Pleckstrin homology domain-containing protein n=1 Tax=Lineolata rhizophorae TaxID=578093 RepID=A0A6A6P907_9PEZI|nr:hypothetical protein BDY21DRAFT_164177 [Lineolata rhizophorae]